MTGLYEGSSEKELHPSFTLPEFVHSKWEKMLNLISKLACVKVSLITKSSPEYIEIFSANTNRSHPYKTGDKDRKLYTLYCEAVMNNREPLLVPDAENDPIWCENPDYKEYNLKAYYGEPVLWPNEDIFGTICYLNDQVTHFSEDDIKLLSTCRESVEKDLQIYTQYHELHAVKNELRELNGHLEKKVKAGIRLLEIKNDQLKHKNKELQKTNYELDRFIYSASHDLKGPLTSMQGLVNLCKVEKNKEKFADTYLQLMEKSITNLKNTIQNLSNYSLNARVSLRLTPVNLYELLTETADSLRFMPQINHVRIEIDVDTEFIMHSDAARLKIIFYNLLSNSIKFSDPEKPDSYVRIRMITRSPEVTLVFEDNGLGIPTESQNKVFQLFYRATATSEGPGMGLFIVKETLELLGGSISVASEYGEGTTFKVKLPRQNRSEIKAET